MVNEDLSSVFILDNSPGAYRYNPGIYVIWFTFYSSWVCICDIYRDKSRVILMWIWFTVSHSF